MNNPNFHLFPWLRTYKYGFSEQDSTYRKKSYPLFDVFKEDFLDYSQINSQSIDLVWIYFAIGQRNQSQLAK